MESAVRVGCFTGTWARAASPPGVRARLAAAGGAGLGARAGRAGPAVIAFSFALITAFLSHACALCKQFEMSTCRSNIMADCKHVP